MLYSRFPLAIYFTHGSAYMSVLLSQLVPPFPFSPVSTGHFTLCLHIYSCPANKFISTIFLDSMNLLIPDIRFSLSLLGTKAQPVYGATQEAEAGGLLEPRRPVVWSTNRVSALNSSIW